MNFMPEKSRKKLVLTVTNHLVSDNRVHKVATTLVGMGFDVTLVGCALPSSPKLSPRDYSTRRFALLFNKGFLFYANYNIRLFFYLLYKRFDVVLSNDLDSLMAGFLASKITRAGLVYDSHEYYTELPELVDRPFVKMTWEKIESLILPRLTRCYTVCKSIADIYTQKYKVQFQVVRNLPHGKTYPEIDEQFSPPFPTSLPVILYQGAVNKGRGIEEAILAMHNVENALLVIIGGGDLLQCCKDLVINENLQHKVHFTGLVPFDELRKITRFATIGLSIEKNIGLNYYFALPNKLFDYIQSEVPVLATQLPEIERVVKEYGVGMVIEEAKTDLIANAINQMLGDAEGMKNWRENCKIAKQELCWENEEQVLKAIFEGLL